MPPQSAQTDPYASIAAPAPAAPTVPAAQADPYAAIAVPIHPKQGSVIDRSIQGAKDFAQPIMDLIKPPETPTEHWIGAVTGGAGIPAYRIAKSLVNSVDNAVKSSPAEYADAVKNVVRTVQDFHNKDYRNALADAVSAGSTLAPTVVPGGQDTRDLAEGIRPGGDLARPLTKDVLTAGTMLAGGELLGPEEEAANAATSRLKVNPFRQVVKGAEVAQPAAQGALTDAAAAAAKDSGVAAAPVTGGLRTAIDNTLAKTAKIERAQYDRINEAAGMDLKSLYDREGELQDAIDDPTNIVAKPTIQTELERTRMQIANGESKAAESGIDAQKAVRQAKDLTQQRFALADLKAKIFNNESVVSGNMVAGVPEKINIDAAVKAAERMDKPSRFAPEGSRTRLEQALGVDGAKTFKQSLYDAQKLGQSAIDKQELVAKVGKAAKVLGISVGALTGLYELLK